MANGNKRKGFKKQMMEIRGSKTVFDEGDGVGVETGEVVANDGDGLEHVRTNARVKRYGDDAQRRHVVPPSERGVLPRNVFVTSKEFYRGETASHRARRMAHGNQTKSSNEEVEDVEEMADEEVFEEDLWDKVERHYDLSAVLTMEKAASLDQGTLIAWKVSLPAT